MTSTTDYKGYSLGTNIYSKYVKSTSEYFTTGLKHHSRMLPIPN